jgi:ferredoxin
LRRLPAKLANNPSVRAALAREASSTPSSATSSCWPRFRQRRSQQARAGAGLQPLRWTTTLALDYNPCRECKLCVTSLPVGAISKTGDFDFGACFTHNSGNSTAASQTGCRPWRIARTRPISAPGSPIPKTRPSGRASRSNPGQGQTLYVTEGSPAKEYAERRFPHKPIKEVDSGSPKEG